MEKLPHHQRVRHNFDSLTVAEKAAAVCRMVDEGFSDDVVARATGLAVEQVRQIIGERRKQ